jgi:alkylation response protein AidB-like acyl-CoA dehydrogenase
VRFAFSEDQRMFQQTLAELLVNECGHETLASAWETKDGFVPGLWSQLAEMGILGLTVPEDHDGLGLDEIDWVLLLEEMGRRACPEPIAETTCVAAPLLAEIGGEIAQQWLPRIAAGEARIAVGLESDRYVANAAAADLLIVQLGDAIHAVAPGDVALSPVESIDGARRIYDVEGALSDATCIADGARGRAVADRAFNRGALAAAAQLLGLGRELIDLTVEYAKGRIQFGQPIGAFQAVKHHVANAVTKLEFARPPVYYAAYSVANGLETADLDVSTAKALTSDAAQECARVALQCHGAIAYTYEYHAHMWMKRVFVMRETWGSAAWHRRRAARTLLDDARST